MRRIKMVLAYDGSSFAGWQVQPSARTVQQELEKALSSLIGEDISLFGAGRTDAGVHASGQVIHFDTHSCRVPVAKLPLALRGYLPEDIVVFSAEEVSLDFHACFGASNRVYRYKFVFEKLFPFQRKYRALFPYPFEKSYMERLVSVLQGEHDFSTFCLKDCDTKTKIRVMRSIEIELSNDGFDILFSANGFLRKMIRMVVGSLLQVYPLEDGQIKLQEMLLKRDNQFSGPPATPGGLYLERVDYV